MTEPILAIAAWRTNAALIADVATLGYLRVEWDVLDPTYGLGNFWTVWRPSNLTGSDLVPAKSPVGYSVDFTALPWGDRSFDAVVFDPPYRLNGTPDRDSDASYGTSEPRTWQERHDLIKRGITECTRVVRPKGYLLVKCQDQVSSGQVRWQTMEFAAHAEAGGLRLVDRFDMIGTSRAQPPGRRQAHAHGRASTLLVLQA